MCKICVYVYKMIFGNYLYMYVSNMFKPCSHVQVTLPAMITHSTVQSPVRTLLTMLFCTQTLQFFRVNTKLGEPNLR